MILRRTPWIALLGLGAVAGAVLPDAAGAQVPVRRDTTVVRRDTAGTRIDTTGGRRTLSPSGRDTVRIPLPPRTDTLVAGDSTRRGLVPLPDVPKADTIKAPLARAEAPPILEIDGARIYDRTALFATGVSTLIELLGRVPGLTEYATGFLGAPAAIASQGDLRHVRIFLDGLEMDPMDVRSRGTSAVGDLPIHALEEVRIERGAEEVRVYARSWRVDRTVPYTRADIMTGDQNSNLYRAWFGRRYDHGEALQVAAEQYSSQPTSRLPSSDALNIMLRLGLTHGPWSADAFLERSHRNRAEWAGSGNTSETRDTVPAIETARSTSYLRIGNGDPEQGRWVQLLASSHSYVATQRRSTSFASADTTSGVGDSTAYENQYLVTGGITSGCSRLVPPNAFALARAGCRTCCPSAPRPSLDRCRSPYSMRARVTSIPPALRRPCALAWHRGSPRSDRARVPGTATSTVCSQNGATGPFSRRQALSRWRALAHSSRRTPAKSHDTGSRLARTRAPKSGLGFATSGSPAG